MTVFYADEPYEAKSIVECPKCGFEFDFDHNEGWSKEEGYRFVCYRCRAEQAEAEAALMRVALQSLRRRIDDIIQAATTEHRDLYWLDDGVTQMVKLDADAALASDAGRALLERVRKLERVLGKAAAVIESDIPEDIACSSPAGHIKLATLIDRISQLATAVRALEADDGR